MRPPTSLLAAVSRPSIGSTSLPHPRLRTRPLPPSHSVHPLLTRSAGGWTDQGWQWLQNKLAVRDAVSAQRAQAQVAREQEAARQRAVGRGEGSIFDAVPGPREAGARAAQGDGDGEEEAGEERRKWLRPAREKKVYTDHTAGTGKFKISPRKLQLLASQISGKPIDHAILQMQFSPKRAASRVRAALCTARDHAEDKGLRRERLVVAQAWVNKGHKERRVDIKGRMRMGMIHHPTARMTVVLQEGKTRAEKTEERVRKALSRVRSAGLAREDVPIRNAGAMYAW